MDDRSCILYKTIATVGRWDQVWLETVRSRSNQETGVCRDRLLFLISPDAYASGLYPRKSHARPSTTALQPLLVVGQP